MSSAQRLVQRAKLAQAAPENIPSPCTSVCTMNPKSGLCDGCFRTLEEVAHWSVFSDGTKRQVWAEIAQRASV